MHSSGQNLAADDWSATQYLKFEDERTRPPRDLLAQVSLRSPQRIVDLGCGPGNSTELLVERFPAAQVVGIDSSPDMLRQARERLPHCTFVQCDVATWVAEPGTDLLFGNAVFHWVSDHPKVLARLLTSLPPGGMLAVQMPDNTKEPALTLMEKVATSLGQPSPPRSDLPHPEDYYDLLRPLCRRLDIWHTHYNHVLADHRGVVEWFEGSGMRPFLARLSESGRTSFISRYTEEVRQAYRARSDGKVLLRFPRLFIVASR